MLLQFQNLTIRNAAVHDAAQLAIWWNDGNLMAHAGFPNGTGQTAEGIASDIVKDTDEAHRRLMIELDGAPVGEMMYQNVGEGTAEIGIKICEPSQQNKGYGKVLLSMLLGALFRDMGYRKIILDTNLNNRRAQHVYEELGFRKLRVNEDIWRDQLGHLQSSVDYELIPEDFVDFTLHP